jgi:hypothetical protein
MILGNMYGGPQEFSLLIAADEKRGHYRFLVMGPKGNTRELRQLWRKQVETMTPVDENIFAPIVHVTRSPITLDSMEFMDGDVFTLERETLGLVVGKGKDAEHFSFVSFMSDGSIRDMRIDVRRNLYADCIMIAGGKIAQVKF